MSGGQTAGVTLAGVALISSDVHVIGIDVGVLEVVIVVADYVYFDRHIADGVRQA